jgi:hypothetical protein
MSDFVQTKVYKEYHKAGNCLHLKKNIIIMKKIFISSIILLFTSSLIWAQNDVDALRYSGTYIGGTAKSMSMAGAYGAIGADASSASFNPAGLGVYQRTEYAASASLLFTSADASYRGTTRKDGEEHFNLTNGNMILVNSPNGKVLKKWQFAFGFNELANYTGYRIMEGRNNENSLIDVYTIDANKNNYTPYEVWETYLVNVNEQGDYYSVIPDGKDILQREIKKTSGYHREMYFSGGFNFNDKIYTGITIGVPSIKYNDITTYSEIDDKKMVDCFDHFDLKEKLHTSGMGTNIKLGMIVKANDWIRVGAAIHSPTWFDMEDHWSSSWSSDIDTAEYVYEVEDGNFDYQLKTPWKANGSLGFIFGKHGLINIDLEYVDYASMRLRSDDYDFMDENEAVNLKYKAAQNYRIGGEYNLGMMVLRAGYAYYGSPFKNNINDGSRQFVTAGVGYRSEYFFADLAYVHSSQKENYYPYVLDGVQPANIKNSTGQFVATLGVRF